MTLSVGNFPRLTTLWKVVQKVSNKNLEIDPHEVSEKVSAELKALVQVVVLVVQAEARLKRP